MPEVTLRDGMVLVGSLLILAVMIDAWRRMRSQQRERVRMKLAPESEGAEPADDLAVFRELPNGGARIVSREDLLGSDGLGPSSDNPAATPSLSKTRSSPTSTGSERTATVDSSSDVGEADASISEPPEATAEENDSLSSMAGMRADSGEPSNLDWLNDIPSEDEDDGTVLAETPSPVETEVIILHVMSRDSEGFSGKDILEILLACDLRFGDMNFFHRHEQQAGRGPIQFSVANMLQPGVFDIDNMDAMLTRGLVFFITLPGPEDMTQAFDYMLETARVVARNLGGELLDESRSVLTTQAVEHSRQQIRELERRLLAQRG
ncbi:cell division protein ZipA [Congregibacter brevis]|uniref:Cell division protein ZipA n=1 Tax=Congregibacter brevis TaxID=3081201 RepID=A0ABZ0IA55_9GAMM|nr:cell division protein ZipA [Congregibacter sp. IMCC45268]